jgi:hypothetical protein
MATYTASTRQAITNAFCALFNGGTLKIHTSAHALLGSPAFGATAFGGADPVNAVAQANAITDESNAAAGTMDHFHVYKSDGVTEIGSGTITLTAGGGDLTFDSLAVSAGDILRVKAFAASTAA